MSTLTTSPLPSLVIGSPSTVQSGEYQSSINEVDGKKVQMEMFDRLLEHATSLPADYFAMVKVILSTSDYESLSGRLDSLFTIIFNALRSNAPAKIHNFPTKNLGKLSSLGFVVTSDSEGSKEELTITKPIKPKPLISPAVSLPLRSKTNGTSKEAKKALWAVNLSKATSSIDEEALLTEKDRAKPPECNPVTALGGKRRRRACKGCTCGLAELDKEEKKQSNVVIVDGSQAGLVQEVAISEKDRLLLAAKTAPNATSSCGSCYLGDAFRCASCPYLGLPAFQPGEKVEIDLGSGDI